MTPLSPNLSLTENDHESLLVAFLSEILYIVERKRCPSNIHIKISVIIPVYNREDMITNCLESVIKQTYAPDEIIVIASAKLLHKKRKNENLTWIPVTGRYTGLAMSLTF